MSLQNCSEILETASLLKTLKSSGHLLSPSLRPQTLSPQRNTRLTPPTSQTSPETATSPSATPPLPDVSDTPGTTETPKLRSTSTSQPPPQPAIPSTSQPSILPSGDFVGDQMNEILANMCKRGGFIGAVVADHKGLALADFNTPVSTDAIAACSSVLGSAIEKVSRLLEQQGANNISLDINYVDKVALRHFEIDLQPYYLMVVCPQQVDERSEIEVSIEQITSILGKSLT